MNNGSTQLRLADNRSGRFRCRNRRLSPEERQVPLAVCAPSWLHPRGHLGDTPASRQKKSACKKARYSLSTVRVLAKSRDHIHCRGSPLRARLPHPRTSGRPGDCCKGAIDGLVPLQAAAAP